MRKDMTQLMKDEFLPFRHAIAENRMMRQSDIDYNLAKIRQRINEIKTLVDLSL